MNLLTRVEQAEVPAIVYNGSREFIPTEQWRSEMEYWHRYARLADSPVQPTAACLEKWTRVGRNMGASPDGEPNISAASIFALSLLMRELTELPDPEPVLNQLEVTYKGDDSKPPQAIEVDVNALAKLPFFHSVVDVHWLGGPLTTWHRSPNGLVLEAHSSEQIYNSDSTRALISPIVEREEPDVSPAVELTPYLIEPEPVLDDTDTRVLESLLAPHEKSPPRPPGRRRWRRT